jgi:hypothetical protein
MTHPTLRRLCLALHACSAIIASVAAVTATSALAQSQPAQSQSATQSVEVRASAPVPVRTDLQQLCPDAGVDLPDALARTAQEVATASLVTVQFEIEGSRVRAVQTQGGVGAQARAVRRAVHSLACSNGQAGRQRVQFSVRFVDPFVDPSERAQRAGLAPAQHLALVEVPASR